VLYEFKQKLTENDAKIKNNKTDTHLHLTHKRYYRTASTLSCPPKYSPL
jgi:hypothetical protein